MRSEIRYIRSQIVRQCLMSLESCLVRSLYATVPGLPGRPAAGQAGVRCAAIRSRYQANDAFGVRRWVSKSVCTSPNRWW